MPNYIEETKEIEVPPASGIPGFLRVVSDILGRSRVQEIVISKGKIAYRRFRKEDEPEVPLAVDLDTLMPSFVIRAGQVEELALLTDDNAAVAVSMLFAKAHMDGLNPIALVGGRNSQFFSWHTKTTDVVLARDECYGLPFLADHNIPDETVLLCAGYGRRASLPDTVRSYKISIPLTFVLRGKS